MGRRHLHHWLEFQVAVSRHLAHVVFPILMVNVALLVQYRFKNSTNCGNFKDGITFTPNGEFGKNRIVKGAQSLADVFDNNTPSIYRSAGNRQLNGQSFPTSLNLTLQIKDRMQCVASSILNTIRYLANRNQNMWLRPDFD